MRRARLGGKCEVCGTENKDGIFWEDFRKVLFAGTPGVTPMEPGKQEPIRCDKCEYPVPPLPVPEKLES